MTSRPLKSTAKPWAGAKRPEQAFRDRKTITLPDGSKREVYGYGATKQAATRDLYAKVAAAQAQAAAVDTVTVTQVMARLARHKRRVKGRKAKTIFNDVELYRRHIGPYLGDKPIAEVTLDDLEAVQTRLVDKGHYRTAELATILLRSLYKHALRHYRADVRAGRVLLFDLTEDLDPVKRPAGAEKPKPKLWTVEQLGLFLEAAKARYDRDRSSLLYPVFHTAIAAGLRRGELLGLTRADLLVDDDGNASLRVDKQLVYYGGKHHPDTPKSPSGVRAVPIGPELVAVLELHKAKLDKVARLNPNWEATDLLFPSYNGRPLDPRNLYRARDELVDKINEELAEQKSSTPKLARATLHAMRGVYGTYVTKTLVEQKKYSPKLVMYLLGHSHPDRALQFYTEVIGEDLAGATFEPSLKTKTGISTGTGTKEKDAIPLETAS